MRQIHGPSFLVEGSGKGFPRAELDVMDGRAMVSSKWSRGTILLAILLTRVKHTGEENETCFSPYLILLDSITEHLKKKVILGGCHLEQKTGRGR